MKIITVFTNKVSQEHCLIHFRIVCGCLQHATTAELKEL